MMVAAVRTAPDLGEPEAASLWAPWTNRPSMTVAVGSDAPGAMPDAAVAWLRERGHDVLVFGCLASAASGAWTSVAREVARSVTGGTAEMGVLCCWTGTGVTMAANKVPGVRAALCHDAPTAAGAREWNDANVLCLSMRATTPAVAAEILDAWFAAAATEDPIYRAMIGELDR
jgi:ribose 5-phosphate isomerase B